MTGGATTFEATLARHAAAGADAILITALAVTAWRGIDGVLSPIIGRGGVSALFERSLYLASAAHPELIAAHDDARLSGNFAALQAAYAGASSVDAAAAHGALLVSFCGLLAGLVGEPLTERLLQPVWDTLQSGDPAKDDAS
jgi:hypothetical protein